MALTRLHNGAALLVLVLAGGGAFGALSLPVRAECALPGGRLKPIVLERFEKEPKALLNSYPRGGYAMNQATALLAARGPRATAQLFTVMPNAQPDQLKAIGGGLRRYVNICAAQDPSGIRQIATLVAASGLPELNRAFHDGDDLPLRAPSAQGAARRAVSLPDDLAASARNDNPFRPPPDPFGRPEEWR